MKKITRKHKHWVYGKKEMKNIRHPISQKHRNIQSKMRHDISTGKFDRWRKRKGLKLLDATYNRYKKEVLKR